MKNTDRRAALAMTTAFVFVLLFLQLASPAHAALITKNIEGEITSNVLGVSTQEGFQYITNSINNLISKISLNVKDDTLVLSFEDQQIEKEINIEEFEGDLVEIQKHVESSRVILASNDGIFYIKQRGIMAQTSFNIILNSNTDELLAETQSGERVIKVLPYEAVAPLVKTNILSEISPSGKIELIELEEGELVYEIKGERKHSIFSFFNMPAEVLVTVSATTGKVLAVDTPSWSRILSFLSV